MQSDTEILACDEYIRLSGDGVVGMLGTASLDLSLDEYEQAAEYARLTWGSLVTANHIMRDMYSKEVMKNEA